MTLTRLPWETGQRRLGPYDAGVAELGYLFVVTYGRSGSTLLTGVLNAIPGYLIRGENGDALRHLHDFHTRVIAEKRAHPRAGAVTHPHFGIESVPRRRMTAATRRLVVDTLLRPEPETRVVGFKEIRWHREDLLDYATWLAEVFPGARFLVNTRRHADVLASKWWAKGDTEANAAYLRATEARFEALGRTLGDAVHRVHYDDYVADPTALRPMFDWLGEPFDETAVRATMAVRHSV